MNTRTLSAALVALSLAACGGDTEEVAEAPATPEMSADEMAIDQIRQDWVTHYNMGHASVVAGYYQEDAWSLGADGTNSTTREAIEADMAMRIEASSPQIELTQGETMLFGDRAVSWGTYATTAEGPDGSVSQSGTFMTTFLKTDGDWKIQGVITNFDAAPPEGFPYVEGTGDVPANEGTMTELVSAYETHWNLDHPSMVADLYTADTRVAFADAPMIQGRDAVDARLTETMGAGPTSIAINDLGTVDLGDGWALDGGWYVISAPDDGPAQRTGMYLSLVQQTADGPRLHWAVTNGRPADGM